MCCASRICVVFTLSVLLLLGCSDRDQTPFGVDVFAPDKIEDASISYADSTGDVYVTWTAPGDGESGEAVERYEIRYLYDLPFDWETALPVIDPPLPAPPGEKQSYRFRYPEGGRSLSVAIASADASGNQSAPSEPVSFHVPGYDFRGECLDVHSKMPLEGIRVELEGRDEVFSAVTNDEGEFWWLNVAPQEANVSFRFDSIEPGYFNLVKSFVITRDVSDTFLLIPYQRSEVLPSMSLLGLFKRATDTELAQQPRELLKWAHRPVATYVPEFVNSEGVDYGDAARRAVERWMNRTGITLWAFVDSVPEVGVEFQYKPRSEMGGLIAITRHTQGPDGLPLRDVIEITDDLTDPDLVYRVLLHEVGHTIRLKHLPAKGFIMYGGGLPPDDITDDEVRIVKLLEELPNRIDMNIYREVEP